MSTWAASSSLYWPWAALLRQIYQGQRSSFRSKSLTAQMTQPGWLTDVNTLRERLDLSAL
jgi:hypothetical protein